jgi:hypothetical protein
MQTFSTITSRSARTLEGKTPAEACGIKVEGDNKWLTLARAHKGELATSELRIQEIRKFAKTRPKFLLVRSEAQPERLGGAEEVPRRSQNTGSLQRARSRLT